MLISVTPLWLFGRNLHGQVDSRRSALLSLSAGDMLPWPTLIDGEHVLVGFDVALGCCPRRGEGAHEASCLQVSGSQVEFVLEVEQHGQIGRLQLRLVWVGEHLSGGELSKADHHQSDGHR